ncbi:MAG TPA: preprotein translocase subunit SecY, partial [Eubacteriales bacterium]|nr:preprotein translocase subunit SecY [Eubacteriales bacterium]
MDVISLGEGTLMSVMNAITGSALSQGTLFAVGISPYINASIIMQLLAYAIPALERMSKEGEEGKKKIEKITRYVTLGLAIVNAIAVMVTFDNASTSTA